MKTKKNVKKNTTKKVPYQKALTKRLKRDFGGIKTKNLGDNMMEISFK